VKVLNHDVVQSVVDNRRINIIQTYLWTNPLLLLGYSTEKQPFGSCFMRIIAEKDGNGSFMARSQDRSRCARKAFSYGTSIEKVRPPPDQPKTTRKQRSVGRVTRW
jgi:hypothetical protein